MNFAGGDREWPRAVEHTDRRRQVVMGAQVPVKLGAVRLLNDQYSFDARQSGCQPFRLDRRQQPRRDHADIEPL